MHQSPQWATQSPQSKAAVHWHAVASLQAAHLEAARLHCEDNPNVRADLFDASMAAVREQLGPDANAIAELSEARREGL